jgi:translation initiation factor 1
MPMPRDRNTDLVYSSERGRICSRCQRPIANCACRTPSPVAEGDGIVRVRRESKGRGGKTVTTATGIPLREAELKTLARELKQRCGSGGSVKHGVLEIQGDHCQLLIDELRERGYTVKRAGG